MKRMLIPALMLTLAPLSRAEAANLAVIANPPTMLNFLVLVGAVACTTGAFKVWMLIRGGRLSKCWQWFMAGFACLALAEIILLFQMFELMRLPEFIAPLLLMAMAALFLYGVLEIKKTLS